MEVGARIDERPAGARPAPALQVEGLGFERGGRWLFRNLRLEVQPGEFIALVGPSGVGKTTLLSCLCGRHAPVEGNIRICLNGDRPLPPVDCRARFGIIFQHLQLTPNADLLTNVLCGRLARFSTLRTLLGFPSRLRPEAYALLQELGLGRDPYKWVGQLSGGEQQRVAVARALFQQPDIYFADEPVSSLDSYYAGRVLGLLRLEAQRRGCVVFCVLHNADLIRRFADRVLSLNPEDPDDWQIRQIRPPAGSIVS